MSDFNTPNESVEDTVASLLDSDANHVLAYDDATDTLTISLDNSVSVSTLEADTLIDGADVSHTGELADLDDGVTDFSTGSLADGEFLQNSSGSLSGATPSAGIELITEATASDGDAFVEFSLTGFNHYIIFSRMMGLADGTTANDLSLQFSSDGGLTFIGSGDYDSNAHNADSSNDIISSTEIQPTAEAMFANVNEYGIELHILNPNDPNSFTYTWGMMLGRSADIHNGKLGIEESHDAIRIFPESETWQTGKFELYGVN